MQRSFLGIYIPIDTYTIKVPIDINAFDYTITKNDEVLKMSSNLCYYFDKLKPTTEGNFKVVSREWQPLKEWKPAPDSIFRKI